MVCFLACFGTPKLRKPRKLANVTPSGGESHKSTEAFQPTALLKQEDNEKPVNSLSESEVRTEEKSNCSPTKKVSFDLNVKTHDEPCEVTATLLDDSKEKENDKQEERAKESNLLAVVITSSIFFFPSNSRDQNCADCDEEYENRDLVAGDLEDNDEVGNHHSDVQEESSSLFSLSIDSRKQLCATETGEKEVNSPMPVHTSSYEEHVTIGSSPKVRNGSQYDHEVLNPIENLPRWKAVQAKPVTPLKNQAKENINLESPLDTGINPEPSFKQTNINCKPKSNVLKPQEQQIAADTSLSSWLVESESTPNSNKTSSSVGNSPFKKEKSGRNPDDRLILGALTLGVLNQCSMSTPPGRSRGQSPHDKLITGTVGSYWSLTGQSMDSDSGSSCREMREAESKNEKLLVK